MKKSTKKIVRHLRRYIGQDIIRISGTSKGDFSYTSGEPVTLIGFTLSGRMRIKYHNICLKGMITTLPVSFTDYMWIPYSTALKAHNNSLNQWQGKKVRRTKPTKRIGDRSYMCDLSFETPVTLISASKHHVVIEYNDSTLNVLGPDFAVPSEWELAE